MKFIIIELADYARSEHEYLAQIFYRFAQDGGNPG